MSAGKARGQRKRALASIVASLVIFASGDAFGAGAPARDTAALVSVSIDGPTVYSPADLFATYRERLGQPATLENARGIAASIADRYLADGYARPVMRLDESLIADGVMRINVFEPRITHVTIEGEAGRYRDEIDRIAAGVRDSVPLRRDAIRDAVSQMMRLPGLTVTASTRRDGTAMNGHELVLRAEFAPLSGYARVNNRGTDAVGPLFAVGQFEANDAFGWGGAVGLVVASSTDPGEYLSGAVYLDRPLDAAGTRGTAIAFRSRSEPNERPVDLSDEYAREHFTVRVTRPLNRMLTLSGAFEADDLEVARDGATFRDDRLRILEAGIGAGWRAGATTQFSSTLELRKGINALGAGLHADDLPVDPRSADFLLTQLQLTSFTRLRESWSLRFDGFAQYSGDVLPDIERFKIGGERLGRGFEVVEIAGDQGLGGKMLVRRELAAVSWQFGKPSVYGFYDIAAAWKNDLPGRESAATLGAGLALQGERVSGYAELAKPLTHGDIEGGRSTSLFAELSYRF